MVEQDFHKSPAYQKAWDKYVSDRLYELWNTPEGPVLAYHPRDKRLGNIDLKQYEKCTVRELMDIIDGSINENFLTLIERERKKFDVFYQWE